MKRTAILFLFAWSLTVTAQQVGMVSHWFYKPMVYNPAFTGSGDGTRIMLVNHTQWMDFKGAPRLNILILDRSFMDKKIGLGLKLISDRKGINSRIGGDLFYSYKISFNDNTHLSLGMSFGVINQTIDYSKIVVVENTADVDPVLLTGSQSKTGYDGNAGLAFVCKGLEIGVAVPQLFGNKINYSDPTNGLAYYNQVRHYIGSLKYKFFISKDKGVSIAPGGLIRSAPVVPMQYDGNIILDWNNKFWIGATYKSNYAITANAGFCIYKQLSVGYAYDIITGDIGNYSGLSHEIMLNLKFGNKPKPVAEKPVEEEAKTVEPEPVKDIPIAETKTTAHKPVVNEPSEAETPMAEQRPDVTETPKVETKQTEPRPVVEQAPKAASQAFDYEAYRKHRSDSLAQLMAKRTAAEKMFDALEPPKPQPVVSLPSENTSSTPVNDLVWMTTKNVKEFKNSSNQFPKKGFYVIAGSFHTRELALAKVKSLGNEGYATTDWIYYEAKDFNYVYILKTKSKKEAIKKALNARSSGITDVWIQRLIE